MKAYTGKNVTLYINGINVGKITHDKVIKIEEKIGSNNGGIKTVFDTRDPSYLILTRGNYRESCWSCKMAFTKSDMQIPFKVDGKMEYLHVSCKEDMDQAERDND